MKERSGIVLGRKGTQARKISTLGSEESAMCSDAHAVVLGKLRWSRSTRLRRREARRLSRAEIATAPDKFAPLHHSFLNTIAPRLVLNTVCTMAEQSIKSLFSSAERQRKDIESSWDSNTTTYQQNLAAAIATYEDCLKLADRLSLFSPNETLEDLTSGDLQ
jgi:hypothetical protein